MQPMMRNEARHEIAAISVATTHGVSEFPSREKACVKPCANPRRSFDIQYDMARIAVAQRQPFPDHHRFTAEEAAGLIMRAEHDGLALLTTEKDRARMAGEPLLAALAARAHVLPVTLAVDESEELRALVLAKVRR